MTSERLDFEQYSNRLQLDLISLLVIVCVARKLIINGGKQGNSVARDLPRTGSETNTRHGAITL